MKTLIKTLLVLGCVMGMQAHCLARVGETLAQCQARYGKEWSSSDDDVTVWDKAGLTILAQFHAGVCFSIYFKKTSSSEALTLAEAQILLDANCPADHRWRLTEDRDRSKKWEAVPAIAVRSGAAYPAALTAIWNERDALMITDPAVAALVKAEEAAKAKQKLKGF